MTLSTARWFVVVILSLAAAAASGQAKVCGNDDVIAAEQAAERLQNWSGVYDAYHHWAHCDDGAVAEGFSASVVRMLASHWEQFAAFQGFAEADGGFLVFVLGHIDASTPTRDLQRVIANAKQRCSPDGKPLCAAVEKAAHAALKDD